MSAPLQQKSASVTPFLAKLRELKELYRKKNYELAEDLGIKKRQLINLLNGQPPSGSVERLLNYVYTEKISGPEAISEDSKKTITQLSKITGRTEAEVLSMAVDHFLKSIQKTVEAMPFNSSDPAEEVTNKIFEELEQAIAERRLKGK